MVTIGHYGKAAALPAASPVFLPLLLFLVFPRVAASEGETASIKTVHSEKPYQRGSIVAGDADKFFAEDQRVHDSSQAAKKQENLRRRKRSSSLSASDLLRRSVTVAKLSSRVLRFGLLVIFVAASLWGLARVVMQCLRKAELWKQSGSAGSNPRLLGENDSEVCHTLGLLEDTLGSAGQDNPEMEMRRTSGNKDNLIFIGIALVQAVIFVAIIAGLGYAAAAANTTNQEAVQPTQALPASREPLKKLIKAPEHQLYLAISCEAGAQTCFIVDMNGNFSGARSITVDVNGTLAHVWISPETEEGLNRGVSVTGGQWTSETQQDRLQYLKAVTECARKGVDDVRDQFKAGIFYAFLCPFSY